MPKAALQSHLQSLVCERVRVGSACELGRASNVHRSTVLRFCESGRATLRTAQKLQSGLTALASSHGSAHAVGQELVSSRPPQASLLEIPQDLKALRSMLQTLIALIDGQTLPLAQVGAANAVGAGQTNTTESRASTVGG